MYWIVKSQTGTLEAEAVTKHEVSVSFDSRIHVGDFLPAGSNDPGKMERIAGHLRSTNSSYLQFAVTQVW